MMKAALVFVALAIVTNAHWTHDESMAIEIGAPPGETMPEGHVENTLSMLEESTGADAVTVYRITVGTTKVKKSQAETNSPWSTHKFKITLTGTNGLSFSKELRYYAPAISWSQASGSGENSYTPEFHPGMKPQGACNDFGKTCNTYIKGGNDVVYKAAMGSIQHIQVESSEKIGELKSVKIMEDTAGLKPEEYDGWTPSFIKVNTNDFKTGLGSGVYYIDPQNKEIRGTANKLEAELPGPDGSIGTGKVALKRCLAQFCEEELDTAYGLF
jgi:hypothetical protein